MTEEGGLVALRYVSHYVRNDGKGSLVTLHYVFQSLCSFEMTIESVVIYDEAMVLESGFQIARLPLR